MEILIAANNNDIWLFDLLGGIPIRFTFDPGWDIQPTWSPDGSHIAYTSYQGERDSNLAEDVERCWQRRSAYQGGCGGQRLVLGWTVYCL